LPLPGSEEFTLGRVSGEQPLPPDIDLTPFKGYEAGVSRLHVTVNIDHKVIGGSRAWITDLGSANGTLVNGKIIPAHIPVPIENGDYLTLGSLKLQAHIE
jgi:pSer/pThr/pTyr-binding forkhead associated (FHA) protein